MDNTDKTNDVKNGKIYALIVCTVIVWITVVIFGLKSCVETGSPKIVSIPAVKIPPDATEQKPAVRSMKKIPAVKAADTKIAATGKPKTVDEIAETYGKLEILSLYDGRSFTGAVKERGEKVLFETDKGILVFEAKTVKDIRIIR